MLAALSSFMLWPRMTPVTIGIRSGALLCDCVPPLAALCCRRVSGVGDCDVTPMDLANRIPAVALTLRHPTARDLIALRWSLRLHMCMMLTGASRRLLPTLFMDRLQSKGLRARNLRAHQSSELASSSSKSWSTWPASCRAPLLSA
jgi:hypothetical protein